MVDTEKHHHGQNLEIHSYCFLELTVNTNDEPADMNQSTETSPTSPVQEKLNLKIISSLPIKTFHIIQNRRSLNENFNTLHNSMPLCFCIFKILVVVEKVSP